MIKNSHEVQETQNPVFERTSTLVNEQPKISRDTDDLSELSESDEEGTTPDTTSDPLVWTKADDEHFRDVFDEHNSEKLPEHREQDDVPIEFVLDGATPPCEQVYPISQDEDRTLREYIEKQSSLGRIRPAVSPAGAPVFFVEKGVPEEGKPPEKRLVVNYKGLDKITKKFRYPLPLIEVLFDHLKDATIFSKIDLRSAYHQLRIKRGDEWKTAFRTKYGLYEYTVLPFGLANAPAYFQKFMDKLFKDMIGKFVVIYLDDFLIYSKDPETHREHIKAVLERLRENNLYAKREKCKFGVRKVKFLGHEITAHGRRTNEDKVKAVRDWPVPRNRRELLKFLGLANYLRKFVKNFSEICLPLHRLLRKGVSFFWSTKTQTAFDSIKEAITTAPVLQHVQPKEPFWIETDASDYAIGCVLMQKDKNGDLRPCAFYSRSLRDAERNYCTYEKELLAIKVAFEDGGITWRVRYTESRWSQIIKD